MSKNTFNKSTTNDEFKFIDDELVSYYAANNLLLNSNYIYWCPTVKTYGYDDGFYREQVTSFNNIGCFTIGDDIGVEVYFRLNNKNGDNVFSANSDGYTGNGYLQIPGYLKTDIIRPITTNALNIYPQVDGTAMSLLISPTSAGWAATNSAQLNLGNTSHYIKAVNGSGVTINASNAITLSGSAVNIGSAFTAANASVAGSIMNIPAFTYTSSTSTPANVNITTLNSVTLNGTGPATQASTLYIAGAPTAGTMTITNPYSLNIAAGNILLAPRIKNSYMGYLLSRGTSAQTLGTGSDIIITFATSNTNTIDSMGIAAQTPGTRFTYTGTRPITVIVSYSCATNNTAGACILSSWIFSSNDSSVRYGRCIQNIASGASGAINGTATLILTTNDYIQIYANTTTTSCIISNNTGNSASMLTIQQLLDNN